MAVVLLVSPCYADLIHHYSFNSNASDSVGGANGTLLNGASVSGGVLHLDGVDDFVQLSSHIVPTSGSYTVALFAQQNVSQVGGYVELISQGFSGGGFYIGENYEGTIRTSDNWVFTGVAFPSVGSQHHFAVTVDAVAGQSRLYVDGVFANTLGFAITTTTAGTDTRFGRQFEPFAEFFNGTLDDVRIYDTALSAAEVVALVAPVPEPSTIMLVAIGASCLVGYGLRRKQPQNAEHENTEA